MARRILKDKRVTLYVQVSTTDSAGFPKTGYMPLDSTGGTRWAYYRQMGGMAYWASDALQTKADVEFVIGYDSLIAHAVDFERIYIDYGGRLYQVSRVDTFEGYKRDLTLYATAKSSAGGVGKPLAYDAKTVAETLG